MTDILRQNRDFFESVRSILHDARQKAYRHVNAVMNKNSINACLMPLVLLGAMLFAQGVHAGVPIVFDLPPRMDPGKVWVQFLGTNPLTGIYRDERKMGQQRSCLLQSARFQTVQNVTRRRCLLIHQGQDFTRQD